MNALFRTRHPGLRDYGWLSLFVAAYLGAMGFVFLSGPETRAPDHPTLTLTLTSP